MQEISVFITKAGESGVQVDPPVAGVHSGDTVIWHFHSLLEKVKWVEVEFQKNGSEASKFFECRGSAPESRCYAKLNAGHGHLVGTAPELDPRPGTRGDKYWIRAYRLDPGTNPGQTPESWLDPDIITCDP